MPLCDHFRPPVGNDLPWDSLFSGWATNLATVFNQRWLTQDFIAFEHTHSGPFVEIDVSTFEHLASTTSQILAAIPGVFPDRFEVRVFSTRDGRQLVGAIELISPGNQD